MHEQWLEPVLKRDLAHVTAPDALWNRVQYPRAKPAARLPLRLAWLAAAVALVLAVWGLRERGQQPEFRSADPGQMQTWVQANTGIGIPLRTQPPPSIRLMGAHLIAGRAARAVEITYRAGTHEAALVVSKEQLVSAPDASHSAPGGATVVAWTMHGQRYMLSCSDPGDLQVACLLCHT